jgi:tetratricopeptide (TPR) repeat protein
LKLQALAIAICLSCLLVSKGESKAVSAQLRQAQKQFDLANYGKVFSLLENDKSADAWILKGMAMLWMDSDTAGNFFGRAIAADPKSALAHAWEACYWLKAKHLRDARQEAEKALTLDSRCADAHAILGRSLFKSGEATPGLAEMNKAVELDPKSLLAHSYLSDSYAEQLNAKKSEAELNKLIELHPDMPIIHVWRAELYRALGDPRALKEYDRAIQMNPQYDYAHLQRADLLMQKNDDKRAEADLVRPLAASNLEELHAKMLHIRVRCFQHLGEYKNAVDDLNVLLKNVDRLATLEAGWIRVGLLDRAQDYLKLKDYKNALSSVRTLQHFEPHSSEALALTGKIHLASGQYKDALNDYNNLIAVDDSIPAWYRDRAEIFKKLGQADAARRDLDKAKQLESGM